MTESPVDLLRRAAEAAPKVWPGALGEAAMLWLRAETACHEAVPEVAESARQVLADVAEEISGGEDVEVDFSVTVSTLGTAVGFAREVLALAEQPRTLALDSDVREILGYVSRGRRYVGVEPYPDALARRVLGALGDMP